MNKIKTIIASLVLSTSLLTGCGSKLGSLAEIDSTSKVSSLSVDKDVADETLNKINTAIDFATGTRNTSNNSNFKFYVDGKNAYPALEEMLVNAKESIYVEVFQFHNDYTGQKFANALINKAKQGVKVYFLYDFFGNMNVKTIQEMAKNGVVVSTYNKQVLSKVGVNITHRKVFIADGINAMTGGMNIGEKYEHVWHDTLTSFQGDSVKDTFKEFIRDWKEAGGKTTPQMDNDLAKPVPAFDTKTFPVRVAVTSPKEKAKSQDISRMMIAAIDTAKDNIKVAMPYFSDDDFINHLIFAQKRGVKVSAFIPYKSNQSFLDAVSDITSNTLIKGGVKVFRSGAKDASFSHSKVLTVDNVWSTIGSCNADHRAFHDNQELNLGISDPEFTQTINKDFFDFHESISVVGEYKNIPWYKKPYYGLIEEFSDLI